MIHVEHVRKCSVKSLALILIVSTNVEPMRAFGLLVFLFVSTGLVLYIFHCHIISEAYINIDDQHKLTLMLDPSRRKEKPIKRKTE